MKKNFLIVKGVAGFGNRISTLADAILYAEKTNRRLYVDWSDGMYGDKGENSFFDIFEPIHDDFIDFKKVCEVDVYPKLFRHRLYQRTYDIVEAVTLKDVKLGRLQKIVITTFYGKNFWVLKGSNLSFFSFLNSNVIFPYGKNLCRQYREKSVVYIDYVGKASLKVFFDNYKFKREITGIYINEKLLKQPSVGIHIRATDLQKRNTDYLELAVSLENKINNKDCFIYLATDSFDVLEIFKFYFGERLLHNGFELPKTNGLGIHQFLEKRDLQNKQESVSSLLKDIINLSYTDKFIPFKGSTLSNFIIAYREFLNMPSSYWYFWNSENA